MLRTPPISKRTDTLFPYATLVLSHLAQSRRHVGERLLYVDKRPFSARFYSRETAKLIQIGQLPAALSPTAPTYLAIPKHLFNHVSGKLKAPMNKLYENKKFILVAVAPLRSGQTRPAKPITTDPITTD